MFSAIVMTDFSDLNVFLELSNDEHRVIAIEKSYMLDAVNTNNDPSLNNDESSVTAKQGQFDMLHSIEIPSLDKGKYKLRIGLPRAYWMKQQKTDTCLSFDFIMEYVLKQKTSSYSDEEDDQGGIREYTVVGVAPTHKQLELGDTMALTIMFDNIIDRRALAANIADASRICRL